MAGSRDRVRRDNSRHHASETQRLSGVCGTPEGRDLDGRRESMQALREREGIMASRARTPSPHDPPLALFDGLYDSSGNDAFVDG